MNLRSVRHARRRLSLVAAACMVALVASACGSGGSDDGGDTEVATTLDGLVDAAKQEGSLVWYGSMDEAVVKAVSEAFQQEYDIDVEYVRLVSADLTQRYAAEAEAGTVNADAVIGSHGTYGQDWVDKGWLVDMKTANIPGTEDFPADLYDQGLAKVGAETHGIAVNTDQVSDADIPKDWPDLADPKWKGKILLIDPSSSSGYPSTWVLIADKYGDDVLTGIKNNTVRTTPGMVPMFEQLAAGEGAIGVPSLQSVAGGLAAKGAPVKNVQIPFAPMFFHSLGISADAEHPNAARLFAYFVMTEKGQQVMNDPVKFGRCSPVTKDGCPAEAVPQQLDHLKQADRINKLFGVKG